MLDSIYVAVETLDSLKSVVETLSADVQAIDIAKNYFTSVIGIQTGIFSVIVVVFLAISWFGSRREVNTLIQSRFDALWKEMSNNLSEEFSRVEEMLESYKIDISNKVEKDVEGKFNSLEYKLNGLQVEVNRSMASAWKDKPQVAYIWWLRATDKCVDFDDHHMLRICLNTALNNLKKIDRKSLISNDMEEITKYLDRIKDAKFKIEKQMIEDELKRILSGE